MSDNHSTNDVPYLTTEQMIEVDRAMMEDFRIELIQMMENAGRNLAHLARRRYFNGDCDEREVVVLAGTGGNGGGAMVGARRLHNWGAKVRVLLTKPAEAFQGVPAHQLDILKRMGVQHDVADSIGKSNPVDLIVDGIIGYRLSGNPRGGAKTLIQWANEQSAPTLSLDTPSGIDTTTGRVFDPVVRATATMTLALPKAGLRSVEARPLVGELYLADISVPRELYAKAPLNIQVESLFSQGDVVRLW